MNRHYLKYSALSLIVGSAVAGCGSTSSDSDVTGTGGSGGTDAAGGTGGQSGSLSTSGSGGSAVLDASLDVSTDAGALADVQTDAGDGGCAATQKSCGGACVSKTDPAYGCTDTGCTSCNMNAAATCAVALPSTPNPLEAGVDGASEAGLDGEAEAGLDASAEAAAPPAVCMGACAPGYEDLDGLASTGCETKTPLLIESSSLQLWLRSDRDMNCGSDAGTADLVLWKDQSGKAHDATTPTTATPAGSKPQCSDAASGIHGMPVARFVRSGDFTKDDGTLALDLSFLAGSNYTVFVVERRTDLVAGEEWLLGSIAPGTDCTVTSNAQQAFHFGYRSNTELTLGQLCGGDLVAPVAGTDVTNKPLSLDVGWFSKAAVTGGHKLEVGAVAVTDMAVVPVAAVSGGALGRGYVNSTDTRFQGDIAEVVVYNAALTDSEKTDVETYLKAHWKL